MRLYLCCLFAMLLAHPLQAAVYKCTGANGLVEFKDKPCAPGSGSEITVQGVARSDEAAAPASADSTGKAGGGGGGAALTGTWCEYAVSMGVDGEKDESSPAQWTFTGDSLEYRMKIGNIIKSRVIRSETGFAIENGMLGGPDREWEIVSRKGDELVLRGPIGGHFHLRRGLCR
ncbi:MAG: DUF4124 domain-containing protein [Rhodanobacteraceae bacterium]|nr:DUF4124 domain-containing protein [Rhodanobacteraceae bacterium]